MPVKTVSFLLCFLCLLGMAGCKGNSTASGKKNCPGFDNKALTTWMPYKDNDRLIFASNLATNDTFHLKNTETSAPYETVTEGFGSDDGCNAYQTFQSTEADTQATSRFYIQLHTETPFSGNPTITSVNINLNGNTIDLTGLQKNGFADIKINNKNTIQQYVPKATINNKTYPYVQIAIRDTVNDKSPGIYQVYISKGNGIVAYRDGELTWVKQ